MLTKEEFYEWERASRDTIDVKRCYIDIAGDLVSGLLLSQIIYWFIPGEHGSKLRVEKEDRMWLAKGRTEWWEECRISPKQFDRAAKILSDLKLIEIKKYRFKGSPSIHIWLNINALLEGVNSNFTKGEVPNEQLAVVTLPKGNHQIDQRERTVTETTSEITTETTPKNINTTLAGDKPPARHRVDDVFKGIHAYYGFPERTDKDPVPNYGKEGKAIKRMLDRGFTIVDILACWIKKVEKSQQYKSMVYVNEDIGETPRNGSKPLIDPDKYIKGKYGHLVHR